MGDKVQPLLFLSEGGMLMGGSPDFLPPMLGLHGTWEEILEKLYLVFSKDFRSDQVRHQGVRVIYNTRVLPDGQGKEEGFWHVISVNDPLSGQRQIDFRRAERLPWARPMMESAPRMEIKVFDYDHGSKDKGIRRYIWLAGHDYVLVLQAKKATFFWVTAYYVNSRGRRADLERRYTNRGQSAATAS